jgi:hypothetical protein
MASITQDMPQGGRQAFYASHRFFLLADFGGLQLPTKIAPTISLCTLWLSVFLLKPCVASLHKMPDKTAKKQKAHGTLIHKAMMGFLCGRVL